MQYFVGARDQSAARPASNRSEHYEAAASKHAVAVASTLRYAVDAADGGDYVDALAWLATVEAIGDVLPQEYQNRRAAWRLAARPCT